jgi:hypothetical protein
LSLAKTQNDDVQIAPCVQRIGTRARPTGTFAGALDAFQHEAVPRRGSKQDVGYAEESQPNVLWHTRALRRGGRCAEGGAANRRVWRASPLAAQGPTLRRNGAQQRQIS